ncbi:MAG: hypothetical protein A2086_14010 [Spirochaetes bacterium GWD1_27_9]|nr:MAG: hypothetical protein A2Z98_03275 [Spirochaetes bacterium GWB1_27_13]OHD26381.1 MAG: hypothetical protein A2Y34_05800 [Spirochaetes bacterium GWC1_27_15]OHD38291.1 MAG: hypothetical protein A2086_14010 [Spirochaetes bacterium GWD1_27_9]
MKSIIFSKNWLILIVLCVLSMFLLISCTKKSEKVSEKQKVFFNHYFSFEGTIANGINLSIDEFNKTNQKYELIGNALDHESFKTAIKEDLNSANPVELYIYWAGARTKSIIDKLAPIDDVWQEYNLDAIFAKSVVNSSSVYNGKKYLLPITQHLVVIFYNKKLFEKNNIKTPTSWKEFLTVCKIFKNKKITPIAVGSKSKWPLQFWFDYILLRTAGYEYRQKLMEGNASYTDKEVVRAFQIWSELVENDYFNKNPNEIEWDTGAANLLVKNEAVMTLMGSWLIGYFLGKDINWQEDVDYDFFPFPTIDKNVEDVCLGPIDGIVLSKDSKNIEGAKEVIYHFSKTESQMLISKYIGNIAPNINVPESFYGEFQKNTVNIIKNTPNWAFNYDLATSPEIAEIGLNAFAEFIEFPELYKTILENIDKKIKE